MIYRAERHPRFDRAGFRARWRAHAALGMSQRRWRNILRYNHCDPIDDAAPWDGVALLWYRSEAARQAHLADAEAGSIMRTDEAETFARPVRGFATLVEEHVVVTPRAAPFKLFRFIHRPTTATQAKFRTDWMTHRRAEISDRPDIAGLVMNFPLDDSAFTESIIHCDVIEEINLETMYFAVDRTVESLLTRETILHSTLV